MPELQKIVQLFTNLQNGECWIGVNMQQALAGINADTAAYKRIESGNNIWQLVNHLIYWRKTVIIRLTGKDERPDMADFYFPDQQSETVWKQTLADFEAVSLALINAINELDERKLDAASPKAGQTHYQLLMGCLQHDAYHMGQIVVLKKTE
jgi:uncharacterized damage-inducible protein DinB